MITEDYLNNIIEILNKIKETQKGKMFLASEMIGETIKNDGIIYLFGCGHSHLAALDCFYRAGGLANVSAMLDCDLMILDDLGTEMTTSFSESVLYNVVNTRLNLGKPMIISTNCTPEDMQGIYHDRLISRLVYDFVTLPFCNRDIRHEKKSRKAKK